MKKTLLCCLAAIVVCALGLVSFRFCSAILAPPNPYGGVDIGY